MPERWDPRLLLATGGLSLPEGADVTIGGHDPVLESRHHVGEAAAAAAALAAAWAAHLGELRGLSQQSIRVDTDAAAATLLGFVLQSSDRPIDLTRTFSPVTAPYRTADGRLIHLHGGFAPLAEGTGRLLGCALDADSLTNAVARWEAADLEDALADAGLCGAMVRTSREWASHPQGRAVVDLPAIRVTRLALGDPTPIPTRMPSPSSSSSPSPSPSPTPATAPPGTTPARPLEGVRVLDLTRVLAGPTAGRTLAAHGADVLRVDSPNLPSIEVFDIETGRGKRSAFCDLDDPDDRARFFSLVDEADVIVQSYRQGALDRYGLGAHELAERRPSIVVARLTCYGPDGPWATRRGWEQLAQSASGIAHAEHPDAPRLIPAAATDYTTGYLAAAGIADALCRRAQAGGSWLVDVSLCQTAAWLTRVGADLVPSDAIGLGDVAARQHQTPSAWGALTQLSPIEQMSATPPRWDTPPVPRGSSPLTW